MTLRAKLTLAFALFGAIPMAAALLPLTRALSGALGAEYDGRAGAAALAVDAELERLGARAVEAAREVAAGEELAALARDLRDGLFEPSEAAGRAAGWLAARDLDALAVVDRGGLVLTSGHLPGRAGDRDPSLGDLLAAPPGQAAPRLLQRAGAGGVEEQLVLAAWEPAGDSLRVAAGVAVGARFAERVAELTGGAVTVRLAGGTPVASAGAPEASGGLARRLGAPSARVREVALPRSGPPVAIVAVSLPVSGLARALLHTTLTFLAGLALAVGSAWLGGHLLATRITRPLEALRRGAAEVASGNLAARVDTPASGEVAELVAAFNGMTSDLARVTARAAAAERVAAWREVARRLAHEVKNPLTPVAMSVATLREAHARRSPQFDEIFEEATGAIGEEVRRLARIVDEFGRFARLPAPEPALLEGGELVGAFLALYPAGPPGVALVREVAAGLPAVRADRDQILQVLHNLLRNAFEAVGHGGTVRVAARGDGAELVVAVSDDGPGIAAGDLPRIFEPYFSTKQAGTGLGLAISERIVREHGGRLGVRSEPGRGTTFELSLPAEPRGAT